MTFENFQNIYEKTIDLSSIKTCWMFDGTIHEAEKDYPDRGYTCTVKIPGWVADEKEAKDYCNSKLPFYITGHRPGGASTRCTFLVTVACEPDYWQILGKCYKVYDGKFTYKEAEDTCSKQSVGPELSPKVANFFARNMHLFLMEIENIRKAWVSVPNLEDYYENGKGHAAVYVQDAAYRHDERVGSIMMFDQNSEHQVICEYTPPMTMAEMYYLAHRYSEIYPIHVYKHGAIIPTQSYYTITQLQGKEMYNTQELKDACKGVGNILNVESFPITAIEQEFEDVKPYLKDHQFSLVDAYKNDGCSSGDYLTEGKQVYLGGTAKTGHCDAHSCIVKF
ncbi:C-type lectin domain-containing protein [Caenorhabditis elegans]|uniref:C-type lectin domain-containing protein n=1 Tax=Caenorhabditis elegans TaxID=6239 RepID=Q18373_CAEEL|nr:C-type lectin domain-containing protein [Caenorhabditis elegans]CAA92283.2 C-type lectin domain-containing protein [Caenorhabditis elegans]|eukprot:NP_501520.2 C-type LECtin [Caenorhabditis elegans]